MVEERFAQGLQVAQVARLLAVVVLHVVEDDEPAHLWLSRRRHVPDRHIDGLEEVRHLERSVGRPSLRRTIAAADDEVFCVVHCLLFA